MTKKEMLALLSLEDFSQIYAQADALRKEYMGDTVNIRAIIEFSNHCGMPCAYCGLNCHNPKVTRYRMDPGEIIDTVKKAYEVGYKTIVMQSGEDKYFTKEILGDMVKELKKTGIMITLSCGQLTYEEYAYLRNCGADKYLLKHETSNPAMYEKLHPGHTLAQRLTCLKHIKELGYETGSGFMIGLPGQTLETIVDDIFLLKELSCDMAGIGPFIAHEDTPLKGSPSGNTELTKRAVALTRILLPHLQLPATTALGVIDKNEKDQVFSCGANVIMQKVTPDAYKKLYRIYPSNMANTDIKQQRLDLETALYDLGRIPR